MKNIILALAFAFTAICSINANPIFENWKLAAQHRTGCEMVQFLKAEIEKSDDIEVIREARRLITEVYDPISNMEIRKSDKNVVLFFAGCYVAYLGYMMYKIYTSKPCYDHRDLIIADLNNQLCKATIFEVYSL